MCDDDTFTELPENIKKCAKRAEITVILNISRSDKINTLFFKKIHLRLYYYIQSEGGLCYLMSEIKRKIFAAEQWLDYRFLFLKVKNLSKINVTGIPAAAANMYAVIGGNLSIL